MKNRFDHLKNKNPDIDAFIESASTSQNAKTAQRRKNPKDIFLSISTKMNREQECEKPTLLHLKTEVANDIEKYCHGNKQAILNYLIREGLDSLVKKGELILL